MNSWRPSCGWNARALIILAVFCWLSLGTTDAVAVDRETADEADVSLESPGGEDAVQDLLFLGPRRPLLIRLHVRVDGRPFRLVWRDYVVERFAQLDRDGDGYLNVTETAQAPPLSAVGTGAAATTSGDASELAALAEKRGGRMSLVNYVAFYEQSSGAPFSIMASPRTNAADRALLELLDENNDGGFSFDELKRAAAVLAARDFDDNEIIERREISAGNDTGTGAIVVTTLAKTRPRFRTAAGPILMVGLDGADQRAAEAMLSAYDKDHNGRLRVGDEIDLDDHAFAQLDANSDGLLDSAELRQFTHRKPDVVLHFNLGRVRSRLDLERKSHARAGVRWRSRLNGFRLNSGDADLDVRRNNRDPALNQDVLPQFRTFDRDQNDYLDEEEAKAVFGGSAPLADADEDGKIFAAEFVAYVRLQAEAAATRLTLSVSDLGQGFFELLDTNRDNRLTPRELRGASVLMAARDRNGDAILDSRDIPRRIQLELGRGRAPFTTAIFGAMSSNENATQPKDGPGPRWFHRMDTNADGDVSKREFLGPADVFGRLDTDNDELLDVDEAAAAKKG